MQATELHKFNRHAVYNNIFEIVPAICGQKTANREAVRCRSELAENSVGQAGKRAVCDHLQKQPEADLCVVTPDALRHTDCLI